jgi:hypothetical protein
MPLDPPCWHKNIDDDGICTDCGRRAAIKLLEPEPEPDPVPLVERLGTEIALLRLRMANLLRNVGTPGTCTGATCRADVHWLVHINGRRTPYDADGTNHFIKCPDREQFKRRKHA